MNQDTPNLEIVRKLVKVFPAGPGMPSNSGNLPLHYCVSRAKPSIPIIKALFNACPEGIRSGCEEGYLPLHRFLNRSIVDLEALRQLINYFPDALLAKSTQRGQTPLHVALDNHAPDALAVELLLQVVRLIFLFKIFASGTGGFVVLVLLSKIRSLAFKI